MRYVMIALLLLSVESSAIAKRHHRRVRHKRAHAVHVAKRDRAAEEYARREAKADLRNAR